MANSRLLHGYQNVIFFVCLSLSLSRVEREGILVSAKIGNHLSTRSSRIIGRSAFIYGTWYNVPSTTSKNYVLSNTTASFRNTKYAPVLRSKPTTHRDDLKFSDQRYSTTTRQSRAQ